MRKRTLDVLSLILPAGAIGVSVALAASRAEALPASGASFGSEDGVAVRLKAIRDGVSEIAGEPAADEAAQIGGAYPNVFKAFWRNVHTGRGGWRNVHAGGGWRNVRVAPGWRNGWRNGGWRNWRNW